MVFAAPFPLPDPADGLSVVLSVVVPAYNEAETLAAAVGHLVAGLQARQLDFEVIVVENGSTDGTLSLARRLAEQHPEVRVEHLDTADYGAALRTGLLAARGEVVVNFDADYYDLAFLQDAVARIRADGGPSVIVGSKRAPGAEDTRGWARRTVTTVFSAILRTGFGLRVSDTHGMKAMRRADVEPLARDCRLTRDLFDTELILRAQRSGMAVSELPVVTRELRPARTSMVGRIPRTLVGLVRLRFTLWQDHRA